MTKRKYDTELISEGCRSYHKALFAVMEFRKQVQEAIADAVAGHAGALAAALGLDESKLECDDYATPAHYQTAFDGSEAEVGLKCKHESWAIYYYVWVGDDEEEDGPFFGAQLWLKSPGSAITRIASFGGDELEAGDDYVQLYEYFPEKGSVDLAAICDRVLRRWIELWTKVGGFPQFLPKPRTKKPAAPLTQ